MTDVSAHPKSTLQPRPEQLGSGSAPWDFETDLLVLGSGAGGLAASLYGAKEGLSVLLCEKSATLGGTTARSAGMVWIPCSQQAQKAGIEDSIDRARQYLRHELGNHYRADLVDALLTSGAEALATLEDGTEVKFDLASAPDYHPDQVGGLDKGRALNIRPFDGRRLGSDLGLVCPPLPRMLVLGGMMISSSEIQAFLKPFSSKANFKHVLRRLARYAKDRLRFPRGTELGNGNALVGRLVYSLKQTNADIWIEASLTELIREEGCVLGAVIKRHGKAVRVRARKGVVLATGGFAHSPELRHRLSANYPHSHSLVYESNTGDGLTAAMAIGAAIDTDLASPGLWAPASIYTRADGAEKLNPYGWLDRGRPGLIAVNSHGKRFVNESNSYHDIIAAMFDSGGGSDNRFFFICDGAFMRKRGLGMLLPYPWTRNLTRYVKREYIYEGKTIQELALRIGIDPEALAQTVRLHNENSKTGVDPEFNRGKNYYNRLLGDAAVKPNPNLGPIEKAPFYALRIIPSTLGTACGLKTDRDARVLDDIDNPIPGLYACGSDLASPMRGYYPGPGIALGPAIVFAFRAVRHVAIPVRA
ncbi:FAD-dependent oxidoreductase [Methylocapsa sp. S129]|uniref:FAD-dependent oxidoreductase n=1 Tax=Methylocapsa sp. S129 TaxID=1641869 RepID=UPI00131D5E21|nr:FAD-dependent oxidoreductase [Methylocapsa sp. S129]